MYQRSRVCLSMSYQPYPKAIFFAGISCLPKPSGTWWQYSERGRGLLLETLLDGGNLAFLKWLRSSWPWMNRISISEPMDGFQAVRLCWLLRLEWPAPSSEPRHMLCSDGVRKSEYWERGQGARKETVFWASERISSSHGRYTSFREWEAYLHIFIASSQHLRGAFKSAFLYRSFDNH